MICYGCQLYHSQFFMVRMRTPVHARFNRFINFIIASFLFFFLFSLIRKVRRLHGADKSLLTIGVLRIRGISYIGGRWAERNYYSVASEPRYAFLLVVSQRAGFFPVRQVRELCVQALELRGSTLNISAWQTIIAIVLCKLI